MGSQRDRSTKTPNKKIVDGTNDSRAMLGLDSRLSTISGLELGYLPTTTHLEKRTERLYGGPGSRTRSQPSSLPLSSDYYVRDTDATKTRSLAAVAIDRVQSREICRGDWDNRENEWQVRTVEEWPQREVRNTKTGEE